MSASMLRIVRLLPADIRQVFAAWTSAEALSTWFVCDPGWTATASNDFRLGGRYRVEMSDRERKVGIAFGEYIEIDAPHRLVFTWNSEGNVGVQNSVVTIELRSVGAKTELVLTHDLDPESKAGRAHDLGWQACLASLERLFGGA